MELPRRTVLRREYRTIVDSPRIVQQIGRELTMEYEFEAIKVQALNVGLSLKSPPSCQPDDSSSSAWFQLLTGRRMYFLHLGLGRQRAQANGSSCPNAQPLCFVIPVGQGPFYRALAFCDLIITVEYLEPMKWKLSNFSVLLPVQELLGSERQLWARPALIVSPVEHNTPGEIVMEACLKVSPTLAAPPAEDIADEDISFNAEKGIFTISVRTTIGQAILPVLADRVMQIKRLIELLNIFHQYVKPAKFDICSLRAITLAHSPPTTAADEGGTRYGVHINFDVVTNEMACYLQSGENVPLSLQVHRDNLDRMQPGTIKKRQCIYLLHALAAQPALDATEKGIAAISVMDLSHYWISYELTFERTYLIEFEVTLTGLTPKQHGLYWEIVRMDNTRIERIDMLLEPCSEEMQSISADADPDRIR